jgi:SAM-dependent methyltransferase
LTRRSAHEKPDYGIDAPEVLRNLFLFGVPCLLLGTFGPRQVQIGPVDFLLRPMFFWTGLILIFEGLAFLLYVKFGKFRHRDLMLSLHSWRGDEQVLDVGCGRSLLLAGSALRMNNESARGHCTGIDTWSSKDMGGNSESATRRNLEIEHVSDRCTLVSAPSQEMPFPNDAFDVIVSNLCLHNIYEREARLRAVRQICRVLKPGGVAIISDYKRTGEYATEMRNAGFAIGKRFGNPLYTFPPLRIIIGRKPHVV